MRFLSKRKVDHAPFNCSEWSQLATNATRQALTHGFVHDVSLSFLLKALGVPEIVAALPAVAEAVKAGGK
jgi:hypothetical protein